MSKITRKSYKRKKIIMGAALFGAVGLVSTGFAAWVLSASVTESVTTTLSVGNVSEAAFDLEFEGQHGDIVFGIFDSRSESGENTSIFTTATSEFVFDTAYNDNAGRVRWDGTNYERLSLTIVGRVKNADYLGDMTAKFHEENLKINAAVTKDYIVAPACYASEQAVTKVGEVYTEQNVKYQDFRFTVEFTWGSAFLGDNPSIYYDKVYEDTTKGKGVSDEDMRTTLGDVFSSLNEAGNLLIDITANPTM